MKKFIAFALLTTSAVSLASERHIYDIMYLPSAGTTYGFSTVQFATAERESDDLGDLEIDGYALNQTLGHSITDRLSLEASMNYTNLEADPEDGEEFDSAKGFSDPTVSARFRTMDETFRWDVVGGATISFMDREVESDGDADNLQGGSSLFVGTQFGTKTELFQWAIAGLITHNMESTTEFETAGSDVEVEEDSNNELDLRADLLNKLAEKSYLRSHVAANFTEEVEDDQNPPQEDAPASIYEIGTEYQFLMSQDVLLRAGADYQVNNVSSGQIDSFDAWVFTAGANYQF